MFTSTDCPPNPKSPTVNAAQYEDMPKAGEKTNACSFRTKVRSGAPRRSHERKPKRTSQTKQSCMMPSSSCLLPKKKKGQSDDAHANPQAQNQFHRPIIQRPLAAKTRPPQHPPHTPHPPDPTTPRARSDPPSTPCPSCPPCRGPYPRTRPAPSSPASPPPCSSP